MTNRRPTLRPALLVLATALALAVAPGAAPAAEPGTTPTPSPEVGSGPKVPSALAWGPGGRLYVALRDGRRVLAVDPTSWAVSGGWDVPLRPFSMAVADDRGTLLLGGADGGVVALEPAAGGAGRVVSDLAIGRGPTRVLPLPGGKVAVASTWDLVLRVVDWRGGRVLAEHPLPFPLGVLVRRPGGRVVVADAFGGGLADLDPGTAGSVRNFTIDGNNVRGLAVSGDGNELLFVQMYQAEAVPITPANIDAGLVLSAQLGAIRLADLDADAPVGPPRRPPVRRLTLDGPVHGAADPSDLAVAPDGRLLVIALAGAHQILLDDRSQGAAAPGAEDLLPLGHNQRIGVVAVGRGPAAVAVDAAGRFAVTADAYSDTITVVRLSDRRPAARIALGPRPPARDAVRRGEAAFHDGRNAHDRWMSCASCHPAGHTNGRDFDTFGDAGYGAPKNTPSLLGVAGTGPFTWTGAFDRLSDQVHQSFLTSLRGDQPDPGLVADLVAYLESLPPAPPRRPADDPAARRGERVFRARRCQACHEPPLYTIAATRDVGLDDGDGGHRRFNPPALRGVGWTAPYLHDGRAATLSDVLEIHPPRAAPLDPRDRDDLIAFLESL